MKEDQTIGDRIGMCFRLIFVAFVLVVLTLLTSGMEDEA